MKYDTKTAVKQLTEIWDSKKKPKEMTKEEYKKAVITNLPSADNPDVKDFMETLGIDRPAKTPAEGLEKKQKGIEKNITRKENSIIESAIRRDAVIFTQLEFESISFLEKEQSGRTAEEALKVLRQKWQDYFKEIYD